MAKIAAIKLAKRFEDMVSLSVLDAHQHHNENISPQKVLFTTKSLRIAQEVDSIILVSVSGKKAVLADAEKFETYDEAMNRGYELPSMWSSELTNSNDEKAKYQKFGLSNLQVLKYSELKNYIYDSKTTLLDKLNEGNQYPNPIYVEKK